MIADQTYYFKDLRIEVYGSTIYVESAASPVSIRAWNCYLTWSISGELRVGEHCARFSTPDEVFEAYPGLRRFLELVGE